jgi:hypothetical protein
MMSYQTKLFNNPAYKYVFALLAGFGLATKMTFLPVMFLPLFVLSNWRERWVYLLSIIPSFIIFTLPAAKGYPHMAMWFLNLGTHTGTYGQGESGIIDFGQYVKSLREIIWNNLPMSILALAGTALFIVYKYTRLKQNTENTMLASKYLAGILVVIALNILMVAKHYHSNHYLFPALSLCGYLVVTALSMFQSVTSDGQKWNKMLMPAAFIGITILSLFNITPLAVANEGYHLSNRSTIETENILATKYQDYTKIYYYPVSFNEMASLKWGNVYARQANNAKLRELFPKALFYFNQIKGFQLWETNITPEELLNNYGNKLLLVGGPLNEWELKQSEMDGFRLTKIHEGRIQVIYQIDVAGSPIFAAGNLQDKEKWHLESDLETLSADSQWVVDSMGNKQFSAATLETGVARSGKYAFCLKGKDTYALNYEIKDAGKGDKYRISVWRKGAVGEAFLVISGGNNYPLYIQKDDSFTSDNKGWQKISIDCKIPDDFNGSALKIYLWNNTNATVWFDDFTLTKY